MTGSRLRPVGPPTGLAESVVRHGKLRQPLMPEHYVRRGRLLALVDDVTVAPFTLVIAPAGAGKTSLLAGWMGESPKATAATTAWLSLDEADRDAGQFWSDFIAAVGTIVPGYGASIVTRLRRLAPGVEIAEELLDALPESSSTAFVVVDDLHLVDDDVVGPSLALLAQHLPPWLHLIGLSRRDPNMPLERLRARDKVGEIRFAELRFSPDEAVELLGRLAPSLPGERVQAVTQHADGWVASLQLAALAERSARAQVGLDAPAADDEILVHDYVWHEVLAAEDPDLIDVLQATAVADRVNGGLAQALTGRPDAGGVLVRAKTRGLFVTRIGADGWFEVHSLVRGALVADLRDKDPGRLGQLHARAARWFEDADEVSAALEHWIQADQPREALRLLAGNHAALYDSGREATVARTINAIPRHVATDSVDAMIEFAWCHLLVSRHRFLDLVDQLTWWAQRFPVDPIRGGRVTMLRAIGATMSGRWNEGGRLAREAMAVLGESWWRDPLGRFGWNMVACDVALSERWHETDDEVRE